MDKIGSDFTINERGELNMVTVRFFLNEPRGNA